MNLIITVVIFHFTLVAPKILSSSGNTTITEKSQATLHCVASGNPQVDIAWTKSGVPFTGGEILVITNTSTFPYVTDSKLKIETINRTDSGVYQCKAENGIGSHVVANIEVTVQCKFKCVL